MSFQARNRIWLEGKEGPFLGVGRIRLLEAIHEHGSITEAARQMEMSYKKAWKMVHSMNKEAGVPLVIKKIGGTGGGGTLLTKEGEKAVLYFKALDEKCRKFIDNEIKQTPLILK